MLIGCCHCESESEPPSESEPSSESSYAPPSQNIVACNSPIRCINKLVPTRWRVEVSCSGAGSCVASYNGTFNVYYTVGTCYSYRSIEVTKFDPSCIDALGNVPRFELEIGGGGAGPNFVVRARLTVIGGTFITGSLVDPHPSGVYAGAQNCMAIRTLTKNSIDSGGYNFGGTVTATPY